MLPSSAKPFAEMNPFLRSGIESTVNVIVRQNRQVGGLVSFWREKRQKRAIGMAGRHIQFSGCGIAYGV